MSKTRKDLEFELTEMAIQKDSPYNDGWTREMYAERYNKLKEYLRSIGKQLRIEF